MRPLEKAGYGGEKAGVGERRRGVSCWREVRELPTVQHSREKKESALEL